MWRTEFRPSGRAPASPRAMQDGQRRVGSDRRGRDPATRAEQRSSGKKPARCRFGQYDQRPGDIRCVQPRGRLNKKFLEIYKLSPETVKPGCTLRDILKAAAANNAFAGDGTPIPPAGRPRARGRRHFSASGRRYSTRRHQEVDRRRMARDPRGGDRAQARRGSASSTKRNVRYRRKQHAPRYGDA